jgi:tryptophan aminotransferase
MISLLAGKPAPQTFPINSISLTVRSPIDPTKEDVVHIKHERLAEALQYTPTRGVPSFIAWTNGLQSIYHNRKDGEGWVTTVGGGSQDLLYKVAYFLNT